MAFDLITLEPVKVILSVEDIIGWIERADCAELPEVHRAIERRRSALGTCEHGVPEGEWCRSCREEMRDARALNAGGDDE